MMWRHHGSAYPMHDAYGGWWFLALVVVVLLAAAVAVLLTLVLRLERPVSTPSSPRRDELDAFAILRRYATGEIDDEEARRRMAALRGLRSWRRRTRCAARRGREWSPG
jgi:uncharacterized membrane protein